MGQTAEKPYRRVFNAWAAGEYGYALELSRELTRAYPDYNMGWVLEGVLLYETARYSEGEQVLREAIQGLALDRLHYGYGDLGRLYKFQGCYDEAEKWYGKAIELRREYADWHVGLGLLLGAKGDFDRAEGCYRKATRCSEGRIYEAYLNLGLVLRSRERYEEALECFNKALQMKPKYKGDWEARAGKSDMEKTIRFLMREKEIAEEELGRRVFEASDAGEHAYALELARELRRIIPAEPIWWLKEGAHLYDTARYEEAKRVLLEMIELIPHKLLHLAFSQLGHICQDQGRYDEAEKWYRRAVQRKPEDAGRHIFLGALLAQKGDLSGAEARHRKAIQCAEGCIDEAYLNLGNVLRAQERYEEALECFNKAVEMTPDYKKAIVGKADMEKVIAFLNEKESPTKAKEKIASR